MSTRQQSIHNNRLRMSTANLVILACRNSHCLSNSNQLLRNCVRSYILKGAQLVKWPRKPPSHLKLGALKMSPSVSLFLMHGHSCERIWTNIGTWHPYSPRLSRHA